MNHKTALEYSMYADGALAPAAAAALEARAADSPALAAQLAAALAERQAISTAMQQQALEAPAISHQTFKPRWAGSLSLRNFAIANIATGLLIWLTQFLWKTLFGELVFSTFSWFVFPLPDAYELMVDGVFLYLKEGSTMIDTWIAFSATGVLVAALAWFAFFRRRAVLAISALALLGSASLMQPTPALALEYFHDDDEINISADTELDDSVILFADDVKVDGRVTGDLICLGERVVINGEVGGNLIALGKSVIIRGRVDGSSITASSNDMLLEGAAIDGDLWAASGNDIRVTGASRLKGNAALAADDVDLAGSTARDLFLMADKASLSGSIAGSLHLLAEAVSLVDTASVAGDVINHGDEDSLSVADSAIIGGMISTDTLDAIDIDMSHDRDYHRDDDGGLPWQLFRLLSALIAGSILLWLIPGLTRLTLETGISGLLTAGAGLVTLVSAPIIMLLLMITLIGLPLAVLGLLAWLLLIYLAKIVLAAYIGQRVLASSEKSERFASNIFLTLLVGLVIIIATVNIPAIGGLLSFIYLILGMGMITQAVMRHVFGD